MKKTQQQTLAQTAQQQTLAQAEQQGGEDMKKTNQQQTCFITFPTRLSPEKSREVIRELRKRFPQTAFIFIPKPVKGRKVVVEIAGTMVIMTFPYSNPNKEQSTQEAPKQSPQGFTLRELINKRT